ncbi:MAG: DUF3160 domain-containing protein, partial [Bacteroidota bacterium]
RQQENRELFHRLSEPIRFLVGEPDNLSVWDLVEIIDQHHPDDHPLQLIHPTTRDKMVQRLRDKDPERINARTRSDDVDTQDFLAQLELHFMPQRYTFDAEILQRLVHLGSIESPPLRVAPRGLDVLATLGQTPAEDLLLNTFREAEKWPQFPDTLRALQAEFARFDAWDKTLYNRWMHSLSQLAHTDDRAQFFMRSTGWERKTLNTTLASWAELKHDVLLYAKQPTGAQMGGGDGDYPPPVLKGYVEPNPLFWQSAAEIMRTNAEIMERFGFFSEKLQGRSNRLLEMLAQCETISEKQLAGKARTDEEYEFIRYIGGAVEQLTLEIADAPYMSWYEVSGPDRFLAVVADVYSYNAENPDASLVLEEGVGFADDLYVVVEMDGYWYLTKGAVFSYYEFHQPIADRLTDEAWQKMLRNDQAPQVPVWMDTIRVP